MSSDKCFLTREEDETNLAESNFARQFLERCPGSDTAAVFTTFVNNYLRFLDGGASQDPLVLQNWFTHTVELGEA